MDSVNDAEELYQSMELGPYIPKRICASYDMDEQSIKFSVNLLESIYCSHVRANAPATESTAVMA